MCARPCAPTTVFFISDTIRASELIPCSRCCSTVKPSFCFGKERRWLPQVALNFAFLPSCVEYCAFGTSRAAAVEQNLALVGVTVPPALWAEAKEQSLIHEASQCISQI